MRVLHVATRSIAPQGGFGGLERSAADHVDRMRGLGYTVCVHTDGGEQKNVPWPALKRPRSVFFGIAYLLWIRRLARSLNACVSDGDWIHFHGSSAHALSHMKDASKVATVLNPHGLEEFDSLSKETLLVRPLLRFASRSGARRVSAVVSTDNILTPRVIELLQVDRTNVAVIPNSVDVDRIDRYVDRRPPVGAQNPPQVISIGRMEFNKGYDILATALSKCQGYAWSWTHFGTGSQRDEIERVIMTGGLAGRVNFVTGASDSEVHRALSSADIFVQPSRFEGSSLTTLEAMTHRRLVIGCRVGGIPDKIEDGVTGILCDPNVESMSSSIRRAFDLIAEDPNGARRIGDAARARVEQRFSASVTDSLYRDLYESLAES